MDSQAKQVRLQALPGKESPSCLFCLHQLPTPANRGS